MRRCVERRLPSTVILAAVLALSAFPECALSQTSSVGAPPGGPAVSWAGAFVGGQVVGSLSTVGTSEFTVATGTLFHHFDSSASGGGGGVNFGYNWQPWANNWLLGWVFGINGFSDSGGHVFSTMNNLTGSAQFRGGFLAAPALLLYGQTGIAAAKDSIKVNFGGPISQETRLVPGYAIGAGAEWALPFAPPKFLSAAPSLFADYQHIWWSSGSMQTPPAVPTLSFQWQRQSNMIEAGLRLHF
jgi:hypothetical protein